MKSFANGASLCVENQLWNDTRVHLSRPKISLGSISLVWFTFLDQTTSSQFLFLKSSARGTQLILCKLGTETRGVGEMSARLTIVCSAAVVISRGLAKERDCSKSISPPASEGGSRRIIALTSADNRTYGVVHRSFNPDADHPKQKHLTLAVAILFSFIFC